MLYTDLWNNNPLIEIWGLCNRMYMNINLRDIYIYFHMCMYIHVILLNIFYSFSFCTWSWERPHLEAGKAMLTVLVRVPLHHHPARHKERRSSVYFAALQHASRTTSARHIFTSNRSPRASPRCTPLMQRRNSWRILHPYYKPGARREAAWSTPAWGHTAESESLGQAAPFGA